MTKKDPAITIPEELKLWDGRRIRTVELINRVSDYKIINLKTRLKSGQGYTAKYTLEDRKWICTATTEQVMARFKVSPLRAKNLLYTSRIVVHQWKKHERTN